MEIEPKGITGLYDHMDETLWNETMEIAERLVLAVESRKYNHAEVTKGLMEFAADGELNTVAVNMVLSRRWPWAAKWIEDWKRDTGSQLQ